MIIDITHHLDSSLPQFCHIITQTLRKAKYAALDHMTETVKTFMYNKYKRASTGWSPRGLDDQKDPQRIGREIRNALAPLVEAGDPDCVAAGLIAAFVRLVPLAPIDILNDPFKYWAQYLTSDQGHSLSG